VHDVEQELGEALAVFCCGWSFVDEREFLGVFEALAGEFVEADGDGLAEVHGEMARGFLPCGGAGREHGDGGEERGVAELVVGEAGFFRAEEQGYAGLGVFGGIKGGEEDWGGLLEGEDGTGKVAVADGCGGGDEGAIRDGFGEGGEAAGLLHDGGGGDGGFGSELGGFELGGFEGGGVVVDDAEVVEAEVLHGAGGGADVAGVAGADQDDGEAGACGGEEHGFDCRRVGLVEV